MSYILLALIPAALFAAVNHIDKFLVEKYFKKSTVGSLLIFSSLIGIPTALIILLIHPDALQAPVSLALLTVLNGSIYVCSLIPYLHALESDEASIVAPLFQMVAIISFILGFMFLGEKVTGYQLIGALIIMIGGIILSLDMEDGAKIRFKWRVFLLMFGASVLTAVNGLLFKLVAVDTHFLTTLFWEYVGFVMIAVVFLVFVGSYRRSFISVWKESSRKVIALNGLNEVCAIGAKVTFHFATLFAPVSLIFWVEGGFQPFFVLVFGVMMTLWAPALVKEKISRKHLVHRIASIGILCLGLYIASLT